MINSYGEHYRLGVDVIEELDFNIAKTIYSVHFNSYLTHVLSNS